MCGFWFYMALLYKLQYFFCTVVFGYCLFYYFLISFPRNSRCWVFPTWPFPVRLSKDLVLRRRGSFVQRHAWRLRQALWHRGSGGHRPGRPQTDGWKGRWLKKKKTSKWGHSCLCFFVFDVFISVVFWDEVLMIYEFMKLLLDIICIHAFVLWLSCDLELIFNFEQVLISLRTKEEKIQFAVEALRRQRMGEL